MLPAELAPSILSCDFSDFRTPVREMMEGGADWIHFDVMDGQFVPPITFGAQLVKDLRQLGSTRFEAHLMTLTPEDHFEAFANAGCERIIFHAEVSPHAHRLVQRLREMGISPGIALNPSTPAAFAHHLLDDVDLVLVMTVNPGWGGQQFIRSALEKVRALRAMREDLHIQVDGGIDPTTLPEARAAGANVFVAGSYVSKGSSIRQALGELREACG